MSGSRTIGNFIVSETKDAIIVSDKMQQWKLHLAIGTEYHAAMEHHLKNADIDQLEVVFNTMRYATAFAIVDFGMLTAIQDYYIKKTKATSDVVSEEEDAANLEAVKETQKLKDEKKETDS